MQEKNTNNYELSPWWRRSVALVFIVGMIGLIFMSVQAYRHAPPIPDKVVDKDGAVIFSKQDIESGQEVFLKICLDAKRLHMGAWVLHGTGLFSTVSA